MYIEPGDFHLDKDVEKIKLSGNYEIKTFKNEVEIDYNIHMENILIQAMYITGNVLYKTDTDNIEDLIKLFIKYTYDPCKDVEADLDFSVESTTQMRCGTICPTKKVLFVYRSKVFVAYGRYIFGYDKRYVDIEREGAIRDDTNNLQNSDDEEDPCEINKEDKIENDKIILSAPKYERNLGEYVWSFMIYDQKENILDAFGLYR